MTLTKSFCYTGYHGTRAHCTDVLDSDCDTIVLREMLLSVEHPMQILYYQNDPECTVLPALLSG